MKRSTPDEERLIGYLLGQLSPEEQAGIEERYLSDPEFHQELRAAERELIDRYVRGEVQREPFERQFLSSPSRRQRVEFARALMQSSAGQSATARESRGPADKLSRWSRLQWYFGTTRYNWLPVAAMLVVLVGASLLLVRRSFSPIPDTSTSTSTADAGRDVPPPPKPIGPSPEGGQAQPTPPGPDAGVTRGRGREPASGVVALALMPSLARAADAAPPTLVIDGNSAAVRLELHLETGGYDGYRVVVATPEGVEVWRGEGVKPDPQRGNERLVVRLPATRFTNGDYVVRVRGLRGALEVEGEESYFFRVRRE